MEIKITISVGELIDKITILKIKKNKIKNLEKIQKVETELKILQKKAEIIKKIEKTKYKELFNKLLRINTDLWEVEDSIRILELNKEFSDQFIELARKVYFLNDERFKIKSEINKTFGSNIQEVKEYIKYTK